MRKVDINLVRREKEYLVADMQYLKESTSYRVGELFTHSKGLWDLIRLPFRAMKLALTNKQQHQPLPHTGEAKVSDVSQGLYNISGKIVAATQEGQRVGAIAFGLAPFTGSSNSKLGPEILGCSLSEKLGYYKYIQLDNEGRFLTDISIPAECKELKWSIHPWGNKQPIYGSDFSLSKSNLDATFDAQKKLGECVVAVYADLNVNLIDGSSIWLISIAQVIAAIPGVSVDLYLKCKPEREVLLAPIRNDPYVRIIHHEETTLEPFRVIHQIAKEDQKLNYKYIIVRGLKAATAFALSGNFDNRLCPYITDLPEKAPNEGELFRLERIAKSTRFMLCQTQAIVEFHNTYSAAKPDCIQMPPMIPNIEQEETQKQSRGEGLKIGYAGKFAPQWASEEMFTAFELLRSTHPKAELHIFGDKIHQDKRDPEFHNRVYNFLTTTEGVYWYRGLPRLEVITRLASLDIAWAWRHKTLELNTRELSTKILEYGIAQLPALIYPNQINSELLGSNYPLFANTASAALDILQSVAEDRKLLDRPAEILNKKSLPFSFHNATQKLAVAMELQD